MKPLLSLGLILFFIFGCRMTQNPIAQVHINDTVIDVEIAKTLAEQQLGLGGRESLDQNKGMLFIYADKRIPGFWMKGMQFSLDMIWIEDDKVVDILSNVPVATTTPLPHYWPKQPINYVLEVNAGFSEKNNIKIGDMVEFR